MTAVIAPDVLEAAPSLERTPWAEPESRRCEPTIDLVVVNDQPVVRQAIVDVLASSEDIVLAGAIGSVHEALTLELASADVFLVSLSHSSFDTVEGVTQILGARPNAAVVVLDGPSTGSEIIRAFDAGATGYLFTDSEPEELVHGVRAAAAGNTPLSPGAAREVLATRRTRRGNRPLSTRELEILELVRGGLRNKQIARRLGISEKTVKAHLTRVFAALGVSDRTQAALHADGQRPAR